ncbi:hypothetical protein GOBAR_AA10320 [Gossypium barbadense]|uniref:Uncharacterized protein n=1 Tax=Gossypium barbadense TaxID=3634 RepID=A0A2P5Y407_GOSBA|nr:hypothetical protein GOBAR_AA10320 [Gossypium barbadense]
MGGEVKYGLEGNGEELSSGTQVERCCQEIGSVNIEWIQFAELANVEPVEDFTQLNEEYVVQDPYTEVPRAFDIDLNSPPASENLNLGLHLQIYLVLIETDIDGEDEYDNNSYFDHEVEDYSEPDLDDVPDDINNKCANDDKNVYVSSVRNSIQGIIIRNDPGAHMSNVNPDTVYASEFPEYLRYTTCSPIGHSFQMKEVVRGQKIHDQGKLCIFH